MLLEAGFISLFFSPPGLRPGLGAAHAPSRLSLFLLRWEWFRIYFESGIVKLTSGDYSWRHLTAMDDYYQNGPLPTWIGWYVQQLPHWFHAATAFMTLAAELGLVWMLFLPRRFRIICFLIVTPFQAGIILTANYTFLNYLVLVLGFLLLDDGFVRSVLPQRWKNWGEPDSNGVLSKHRRRRRALRPGFDRCGGASQPSILAGFFTRPLRCSSPWFPTRRRFLWAPHAFWTLSHRQPIRPLCQHDS